VTVDRERREVRFPCRFVNPTQLIEVFGCHSSGPTHETVVEYDVSGPELYRALLAIGCRPASYWNATSPHDFFKNRGDRLLLVVRWKEDSEEKEYPAEGMLLDGEMGFPAFVRGFSFAARSRPVATPRPSLPAEEGDRESGAKEEGAARPPGADGAAAAEGAPPGSKPAGPESEVPEAVEITLGATNRQSHIYSLLLHPTGLPRLQRFALPPAVNKSVVRNLEKLIAEGIPATLIIRRVASEVDLLASARATDAARGLTERLALHEKLLPLASEIDALKREYEGLIAELQGIVQRGESKETPPEEAAGLARRSLGLLARGRWLCARIESLYLALQAREEEHKLAWLGTQGALPAEVREEAEALARHGVLVEAAIARKEEEIAALKLPGAPADAGDYQAQALGHEIEALELERGRGFTEDGLRRVARRLKDADDPYIRALFEEDRLRAGWQLRMLDARARHNRTLIDECRARHDGSWEGKSAAVLKERARADQELKALGIEDELLKNMEEMRWMQSDAESEFPERRAEAQEKLKDLRARQRLLEEELEKARKEIEKARG
jgi:hypothetical protein